MEVAAGVPEEVEDPVDEEPAPVAVPAGLLAPEEVPEDGEEPDAPVALAADPLEVPVPAIGAGVAVTMTAEERRQLRWQVS